MYADDLVLLSETSDGLQNCLSKLNQYCEEWGLQVNVKKTKCMIFNNTGKLVATNLKYNNFFIENVRNYCYLGIKFSITGSFTEAKQNLYNRGLKAYFKLKKCFEYHKPKIGTILHAFDHTVKPILLYGSEIWGMLDTNRLNKFKDNYFQKLCNDLVIEKLHIKVCKYILEVSRRSTNLAVMGELGRYPLYLEVILNMIKYWVRLSKMDDCLAAEALKTSESLHVNGKKSWVNSIYEIINYFNLDISKVSCLKVTLKKYLNKIFYFKYKNIWKNSLFNDNKTTSYGNKLRTYRLFKNTFNQENYLKWGSYDQRKAITKFRISSHCLEIERGRYQNIPVDNRICKLCSTNIENEIHFLLEYPKLQEAREKILHVLENKYKNIVTLSNDSKFIWLMSAEDSFIYNQLYLLLNNLFKTRQELLSKQ